MKFLKAKNIVMKSMTLKQYFNLSCTKEFEKFYVIWYNYFYNIRLLKLRLAQIQFCLKGLLFKVIFNVQLLFKMQINFAFTIAKRCILNETQNVMLRCNLRIMFWAKI